MTPHIEAAARAMYERDMAFYAECEPEFFAPPWTEVEESERGDYVQHVIIALRAIIEHEQCSPELRALLGAVIAEGGE